MKNTPRISIIFPNHNGGTEPLDFLKSIFAQKYLRTAIEVIIIDNQSTDFSIKKIEKKYPNVLIIKNNHNPGFSQTINQGLLKARGKYLCIANDDVVFEKNCIARVIEFFEKHPNVGVIGGRIYSKQSPSYITSVGYYFNYFTGNAYPNKGIKTISEPDWIEGCGLFLSRKLFVKIGLLDIGYPHYFEDFDYCLRARAAGYRVVALPDVIMWHRGSTTVNKRLQDKYIKWYVSKIRFIIKNLPIINILSILSFQTFVVIPYRTVVLRDGRLIPYLSAFLKNISGLKETLTARKMRKLSITYKIA